MKHLDEIIKNVMTSDKIKVVIDGKTEFSGLHINEALGFLGDFACHDLIVKSYIQVGDEWFFDCTYGINPDAEYIFRISNRSAEGCTSGYIKLKYSVAQAVYAASDHRTWEVVEFQDSYCGFTEIDIHHPITPKTFEKFYKE